MVEDALWVPTPFGWDCLHCAEPVVEGDQGYWQWAVLGSGNDLVGEMLPVHRECGLRSAVGSVEHFEGKCSCASDSAQASGRSWREQGREVMEWLVTHSA